MPICILSQLENITRNNFWHTIILTVRNFFPECDLHLILLCRLSQWRISLIKLFSHHNMHKSGKLSWGNQHKPTSEKYIEIHHTHLPLSIQFCCKYQHFFFEVSNQDSLIESCFLLYRWGHANGKHAFPENLLWNFVGIITEKLTADEGSRPH